METPQWKAMFSCSPSKVYSETCVRVGDKKFDGLSDLSTETNANSSSYDFKTFSTLSSSSPESYLAEGPIVVCSDDIQYSVKVIPNPSRKSEFTIERLRDCEEKFSDVGILKAKLQEVFLKDTQEIDVGYIEPGHGSRGKLRWLSSTADLEDMYALFSSRNKKEILLWCCPRKKEMPMQKPKPPATGNSTAPTQHQQHVSRLENVDNIFQQLREKHDNFSDEQIRTWAHMISMHRHDSYELPPDKPFFRKRKVPKVPSGDDGTGVSPGKKLSMRSECIDQLHKWHDLYEKRAISKEQYEEFQRSILGDMKRI